MNLFDNIRERLQQSFAPSQLDIIDDSHKHIGHVGSQNGGSHLTVKIKADCFENKTRIDSHRKIYEVLADLIPEKIHALHIIIL